jgi:hypothetical protein
MIHTQHSWVAFVAAVITCLAFAARVHAQSPVPTPSPSATSANEQRNPLQQITVTGYIIPHVGERTTAGGQLRSRLYPEEWQPDCH